MKIVRIGPSDVDLMRALNAVFAEAFAEPQTYAANPPADAYLRTALSTEHVIALAAVDAGSVLGGLVAYELEKLEMRRREVYIYDLAVGEEFRRRGIASALIRDLQGIAKERGAYVIFVQADYGDDPAIALYEKFGVREEVLHFDISV